MYLEVIATIVQKVKTENCEVATTKTIEYPGGSRDRGVVETLASWRPLFEAATDFSPFTTTTPTANHPANHLEWQLRARA